MTSKWSPKFPQATHYLSVWIVHHFNFWDCFPLWHWSTSVGNKQSNECGQTLGSLASSCNPVVPTAVKLPNFQLPAPPQYIFAQKQKISTKHETKKCYARRRDVLAKRYMEMPIKPDSLQPKTLEHWPTGQSKPQRLQAKTNYRKEIRALHRRKENRAVAMLAPPKKYVSYLCGEAPTKQTSKANKTNQN